MPINSTPRGSRGGIPSGYVIGRKSAGTGAAEMIPISELQTMLFQGAGGRLMSEFKDNIFQSQLLTDIISKVGDTVNTPLAIGLLNLTNHVNDVFKNTHAIHGANARAITVVQTDVINVTTDVAAVVDTVTVLGASVDANTASIATESTARASGDSANATSISTLSTTVAGHTSSISSLTTSVDGVYSEYVVKIDTDGYVAGFGLIGSGSTSAFSIVADQFKFVKPGGTPGSPLVPFQITTEMGVNVMRFQGKIIADSIDDLSVDTGKITPNALTQNASGTDAGPHSLADGTPGAATAEYPVTSFGVPSGEIGNYLYRITATIDYEISASASIEWRLRNNSNALTAWTDLGYASAGGTVTIYLPDWLGGPTTFDMPPFNAPAQKTLTVDYYPVSTGETSWGIEARTKDGTGASIKDIFITIVVFKR